MISIDQLLEHGANFRSYQRREVIFSQGSVCKYYHQLVEGQVNWENLNHEGKKFTQYLVEPGDSFGELPLFDGEPYAAYALAEKDSVVIRLAKDTFHKMLDSNRELHFHFSSLLAKRIRQKFFDLQTFAFEDPETRIAHLLDAIRSKKTDKAPLKINLTRQQMANLTGLRVETVIRVVRNLNEQEKLNICHGKIFV